ncbi:MAG: helix-turn-helix transcriptional regulator [Clostridia bacterium]|nr:helix-turn-helix transcriptional regulator [Clostridia bacterium]
MITDSASKAIRNLIGPRVKEARENAKPKITQTDLLARLAVRGVELEKTTISKIEAQTRPVTDIELVALSDALGVSIPWLLNLEK